MEHVSALAKEIIEFADADKATFKERVIPVVVKAADALLDFNGVGHEKLRPLILSLLVWNPKRFTQLLCEVLYGAKKAEDARIVLLFTQEVAELARWCGDQEVSHTVKQGNLAINGLLEHLSWMAGEWSNNCEEPRSESWKHERSRALMIQALWSHVIKIIWTKKEIVTLEYNRPCDTDPLNPFTHAHDEEKDTLKWWTKVYAFGTKLLSEKEYVPCRSLWMEGVLWFMNVDSSLSMADKDQLAAELLRQDSIHEQLNSALRSKKGMQMVNNFSRLISTASTLQQWVFANPDLQRLLIEAQVKFDFDGLDIMFRNVVNSLDTSSWEGAQEAIDLMFTLGDAFSPHFERRIAEDIKCKRVYDVRKAWYMPLIRAACLYEVHMHDNGLVRWLACVIYSHLAKGTLLYWDDEDTEHEIYVYNIYVKRMEHSMGKTGLDLEEYEKVMSQELENLA